ncbi:MAG TPA: sulfate adenylyltransferase subunit CysN [Trueperaceae bacterium]|nr:sulfate adenylyltransferase subunit CysN [Trueperaceae bacterium]
MAGSLPRAGMDMAAYVERYAGRDLLRFITCGSVDDGKSTLMGRLLYDAELLNDDSIAAVVADSGRWGTTGEAPDLALLVDGLQSEREQGITIDVAYRYFATDKRKFIMADTPGHEQYTRNMATGASTAELAVILIDARKGVLVQTRRHTAIVSMLGIRQLLVAVNKMDLVDFDEQRFNTIREDFQAVLDKLGNGHQVEFVPISALAGDNVVTPSQRTPWYTGPTLLSHLETVAVDKLAKGEDFRFPVQFVNRPSHDFRGYAGTVTAGAVQVGDEVMVLPSRTRSRVKSIISLGENPQRAEAPQAVTITLEDERDIARGDVLAHSNAAPTVTDTVDANVVWLHDRALEPGRLYDVKLATKSTQALVQRIDHRLDVNTFEKVPAEALALNEIGRCRLTFTSPVAVDLYQAFPVTGSFILIDRLTNATVGAGMVTGTARKSDAAKATNVVWQQTQVTRVERAAQKHQEPAVLWFTGLSGAGKSTIANALEQRLVGLGHHTYLLDGDNVRHGLNKDLTFSDDDRVENIRRIGEVAKLFVDAGLIVMTAFISPFRSDRQMVRELFGTDEFIEVFVDTSLEVAEQRDVKGLYAKARTGQITNFTGIDSPYERPERAEMHVDTLKVSVEEAVERLVIELRGRGKLRG